MIPNHGMVSTVATAIALSRCVELDRLVVDCSHIMETLQTSLQLETPSANRSAFIMGFVFSPTTGFPGDKQVTRMI